MTMSFGKKGSISRFLDDEYLRSDIIALLERLWPHFIDEALGFIVKDKNGRRVAVCLCGRFDFNLPEVTTSNHPRPHGLVAISGALTSFVYHQIMYAFIFRRTFQRLFSRKFLFFLWTEISCHPTNSFWRIVLLQHMNV